VALNKEKVIAAAQKFVEKGQYDKAIKEYLKVVQDDPKDIRIWLKVGDLYAKKGQNPEAVETYEKVAGTYSEQGFYLKAVAVYKQILKLEPRKVDVNLRLAELYKQLGLLSDAMQQFELASQFFSKEGRTRESLDALKHMVEMEPENVASRIKLAEGYSKEGMAQQAIDEFRRAADQLKLQNRTDDYIKVAERLAWHKPDDHDMAKELATLYIRRQDPRRALAKLQVCFKADPRDVVTLELLAESFQALGQHQKTLSVLKELAKVLHENRAIDQRDAVYKRILELEPDDTEAKQALGMGKRRDSSAVAEFSAKRPTEYLQAIEHHEDEISAEIDEEALRAQHEQEVDADAPLEVEEEPSGVDLLEDAVAVEEEIEIGDGDRGIDEQPISAQTGEEPAEIGESLDEEIARTLTETDVFIKYGLHDKAFEHLQKVFDRDPGNVQAHEKLKELHVAAGRTSDAVQELLWLAEATREERAEDAAQYLREALDLEPTNARARALLDDVTGDAAAPEPLRPEIAEAVDELPSMPETLDGEAGDEIEVEEPTNQVEADDVVSEFEDEVSSAIELYPDEIEFEGDEATPVGEVDADESGPLPFGGELRPETVKQESAPMATERGARGSYSGSQVEPPETLDDRALEVEDPPRFGTPPAEEAPATLDAAPDAVGIEDELEEADFFVQQGLGDQAKEILEELLARHPGHPLVLAKLRDIGAAVSEPSMSATPTSHDAEEPPMDEEEAAQSGVLELSRRAVVEKQIGEEDFDTHYDLGIAYKEMGLYDDAIHEFKLVMKAPGKEVICHTMIGLCFAEKGQQTEAIGQFKKALYVEGISEREQLSLYFELGASYERLQDYREALYYYEKVAKKDQKFRDVSRRIEEMKAQVGGGNGGGSHGGTHGGAGGGNGKKAKTAPGASSDDVDQAFDGILGEEAET
jgi:tetratricopeptide (TPR) repeat protein